MLELLKSLERKTKVPSIGRISSCLKLLEHVMQVPHNLQVPHEEVHERVSSILKDYGFCPTGEGISIGNLYLLTLLLHRFNDS
ncbi:hypothetical protein HU200_027209 [Digitaria exilis]|uniref:Uncharacterized protein n=1 Tax=Digitaria exilis TaxID=1010633 RepID=A0A835EWR8_9POAL|nr:hypothetical protein HU200_027209 [Digitaria exilis]